MEHDEKECVRFDLSFTYAGADERALRNVRGVVETGRCIVLCGASGCGKTTLLRCINRLVPDFYEGEFQGCCYINGRDTAAMSIGEVGELAASVFQDPRSQFYTTNSTSEAAFALENYGVPQAETVRRVRGAFSELGLEKLRDRNVFELSSGERQLVAILSARALRGRLLLLDEPTANLDAAAVRELAGVLAALKHRGVTLIISEHRLSYLRELADEFWLMEHGELTAKYTREEMLRLSPQALREKSLRALDLMELTPDLPRSSPPQQQGFLRVEELSFSYKKHPERILERVSLEAGIGEVIGLIGSNGSGKTTLGKLLAGLLRPGGGTVFWNDRPQTPRMLVRNSIFIMQEAEFQFFTNSVWGELLYGREETPQLRREAEEKLRQCGLWACRNRHPFSLSGGQMQKLVLLLACFSPKPIVVLDEPTAGLDEKSLESCVDIIREMRQSKLVFIITHDLELISKTCGRCLCLAGGRVEREFRLDQQDSIRELARYMDREFRLSDNQRPQQQSSGRRCDPRIKFLYLFAALLISLLTDPVLITGGMAACLVLTLYERRYAPALVSSLLYAAIFLGYFLAPQSMMLFVIHYFPRFFPVCLALAAVAEGGDTARLSAALRSWHCPERAILMTGVVFRFFPVLCKDLNILRQSIRTRDLPCGMIGKLRRLPRYFENIVVPMMFRVIRIAESLSASAETRGIAMRRRRESYVRLHLSGADLLLGGLLAASMVLGILL